MGDTRSETAPGTLTDDELDRFLKLDPNYFRDEADRWTIQQIEEARRLALHMLEILRAWRLSEGTLQSKVTSFRDKLRAAGDLKRTFELCEAITDRIADS